MGSLGDNVLGEVLKGVFNWVLSMNLKFKRLDDGLVADSDDAALVGNSMWSFVMGLGFITARGSFFVKCPKLSLYCS